MLIECIGLPGCGKTTMASQLADALPGSRLRSGAVRQSQYRWAKLRHRLGLGLREDRPELHRLVDRYIEDDHERQRQYFNLRWRSQAARAFQDRPERVVSDELLVQGIFIAIGPLEKPNRELRADVEAALLHTYRSTRVTFVHIKPPRARWLTQVQNRPQGRSRFGRATSAEDMARLESDRLYEDVFLPILRDHGFTIHTVTTSAPGRLREIAARIASS